MRSFAEIYSKISVKKVEEWIAEGEKLVLMIGYDACPFCNIFEPKLTAVAERLEVSVAFLDTRDLLDFEAVQEFRFRHQISTVPALLVAKGGAVKVVCDSSISEEEIAEFIELN